MTGRRVTLVTVHFRDPEAVEDLLADAAAWSLQPQEVLAVDNSGELAARGLAGLRIIDPGENLGYATAVNRGWRARAHEADWLLVCTQDARLEPGALDALVRVGEATGAEVLAPVLHYRSQPDRVFSAGGTLSPRGVTGHLHLGGDAPDAGPVAIDWADGAVLLVRGTTFDSIGGFPEEYFLYVEEVDLQLQVRLRGGRVLLVREALAFQEPGNYRPYLQFRNGVHLSRKHAGALRPWPWPLVLGREVRHAVRTGRRYPVLEALRGVADGVRGRMGRPRSWDDGTRR